LAGAIGAAVLGIGIAVTQASVQAAGGETRAGNAPRGCSRGEEAGNKLIVSSLKPGSDAFHELMAADYVQHNPEYVRFAELNGVSGREAVELLDKYRLGATGRRLGRGPPAPGQPRDDFSYKVLADCDFVVAVGEHWHPDPDRPGKFHATYFFNMWRMKDGKLAEHWDPDDLPDPLPDYLKVAMPLEKRSR
jgi:hypothetical protein